MRSSHRLPRGSTCLASSPGSTYTGKVRRSPGSYRIIAAAVLLALSAARADAQDLAVNDMLQTGKCFAWVSDFHPIQVTIRDQLAYDVKGKQEEPFAIWSDAETIMTLGSQSSPIATYVVDKKKKTTTLSFKPLFGTTDQDLTLDEKTGRFVSKTSPDAFHRTPICTPQEAALATAGVVYLRHLALGGTYDPDGKGRSINLELTARGAPGIGVALGGGLALTGSFILQYADVSNADRAKLTGIGLRLDYSFDGVALFTGPRLGLGLQSASGNTAMNDGSTSTTADVSATTFFAEAGYAWFLGPGFNVYAGIAFRDTGVSVDPADSIQGDPSGRVPGAKVLINATIGWAF